MRAERKRVLFLIPTLRGGGAERFLCTLLHGLDRGSLEPHLGLFQAKGEYMPDVPGDVVIHDLNCSRGRYAWPGIARLVWKLRPQAVLSSLPQANMALALSRPFLPRGTRILLSEAALASATLKEDVAHPRLWTWLYRHLYKRADKVICLSNSMIDNMARHFNVPRENLVRIYYPLDLERVQAQAENGGNPYAGPGPHLAAAGRLCRQKGFDLLLVAMPAVRGQFPHARLTILGQGPLLAELTSQALSLGLADAVRFLGFQQNPWPYLKYADVFVLSSRYEGLPNVLLEALALGTPVVATDCPGAVREARAFFPGIELVAPEDPHVLAQALVAACDRKQPRPPMPAETPWEFDLQHIVNEYSNLLLGEMPGSREKYSTFAK